jgi:hypothetical protein
MTIEITPSARSKGGSVPISFKRRKLPKKVKNKDLGVGITNFLNDIHHFDEELSLLYAPQLISAIIQDVNKRCAERIIKQKWRMYLPNGCGSLYLQETMVTKRGLNGKWKGDTDLKKEILLRESQRGFNRIVMKWNRNGTSVKHNKLYNLTANKGFFAKTYYDEVQSRSEDPLKKRFVGLIE